MSYTAGIIPLQYTHCAYCERHFDADYLSLSKDRRPTRDHFIPISKGGKHRNDNIYIVCQYCNTLKSNFLPEEFIYWLRCKIKWKEYPGINGFTYNAELLEIVKKNVKKIYNGNNISSIIKAVPILQKKKKRKPGEITNKNGIEYYNYFGVECPCIGFIDRAISNVVKQYQNVYYHAEEEKYIFSTPENGVVAYYKKAIEQYVKSFSPNNLVNNNTLKSYPHKQENIVIKLLAEPEPNFHYQ